MVVTEDEYKKCHSDDPIFLFNDGDSVLKLDRPGFFYFISGTAGHCERGQKMIVKVLGSSSGAGPASPPPDQSENQNATDSPPQNDHDHNNKNNAVAMHAAAALSFTTVAMSFLVVLFF